jgi:hypothetical protein
LLNPTTHPYIENINIPIRPTGINHFNEFIFIFVLIIIITNHLTPPPELLPPPNPPNELPGT